MGGKDEGVEEGLVVVYAVVKAEAGVAGGGEGGVGWDLVGGLVVGLRKEWRWNGRANARIRSFCFPRCLRLGRGGREV